MHSLVELVQKGLVMAAENRDTDCKIVVKLIQLLEQFKGPKLPLQGEQTACQLSFFLKLAGQALKHGLRLGDEGRVSFLQFLVVARLGEVPSDEFEAVL